MYLNFFMIKKYNKIIFLKINTNNFIILLYIIFIDLYVVFLL